MLHKGAFFVTLLGTILGVQGCKKVKFPGRDNLSLAVKGLSFHFLVVLCSIHPYPVGKYKSFTAPFLMHSKVVNFFKREIVVISLALGKSSIIDAIA